MKTIQFTTDEEHNAEQLAKLKQQLLDENEHVENLQLSLTVANNIATLRVSVGKALDPHDMPSEITVESLVEEAALNKDIVLTAMIPLNEETDVESTIARPVRDTLEEDLDDGQNDDDFDNKDLDEDDE